MVICLGELVVDFISIERVDDIARASVFHQCVGGSPANVAAGLRAMGLGVRLVSKIGRDAFGRFVRSELKKRGVSDRDVVEDDLRPTRCVFIAYDESGRRKIAVANRHSADQHLEKDDLDSSLLNAARMLHLSGTVFLNETTAETAMALVERARRQKLLISFDPNIGLKTANPSVIRRIELFLPAVDVLKLNREEKQVFAEKGLLDRSGRAIQLCTAGSEGAWIVAGKSNHFIPAEKARCVDPTGAGDAFLAGFIARMIQINGFAEPSESRLIESGRAAARCAARIIEYTGATAAYPSL